MTALGYPMASDYAILVSLVQCSQCPSGLAEGHTGLVL